MVFLVFKGSVIFILGMYCSGMFFFMCVLNFYGVDLGIWLFEVVVDNEVGFWENYYVVSFNERVLVVFGFMWDDL